MRSSGIIYSYDWDIDVVTPTSTTVSISPKLQNNAASFSFERPSLSKLAASKSHVSGANSFTRVLGIALLAISLGGMAGPLYPMLHLESRYALLQAMTKIRALQFAWASPGKVDTNPLNLPVVAPHAVPAVFNPLVAADGSSIEPVDRNFGLVIPKIGVNAKIIPNVDPTKSSAYNTALLAGIAHASTSFLPDQDGTVYLFSHSTNYDWFVQDLNAVFYLLKNLEAKDMVVLFYKDKEYVYRITEKRVVSPSAVSYLVPQKGAKKLILQTCWPPGSTTQRLLIFAELVELSTDQI